MNNHIDFLAEYAKRRNVQSYLEIGCFQNECFSVVEAPLKVGVDPATGGTVRSTSNDYFCSNQQKFDLIFIDGDHSSQQVSEDISNSLERLTLGGLLVLHDVLPPDASYCAPRYCNDAWRAFLKRCNPYYGALDVALIPADYGVGLIRKRAGNKFEYKKPFMDITYEDYIRDYVPQIKQLSWEQGLDW